MCCGYWRSIIGLALLAAALCQAPVWAQSDASPGASAVLRISDAESLPAYRKVTLSLNKAVIVELPVDSQDVIVSHTGTVDASVNTARRVILFAKALGRSNVFFLGRNGRKLLVLDIAVQRDLTELAEMLKTLLPGSRLKVSSPGDGIVISGRVARAADAGRAEDIAKDFAKGVAVINMITVAEKEQVLLKVTVAEIQRDAIKRLGVNLPGAVGRAGSFTFTKVIQNAFPITSATNAAAVFAGPGLVPFLPGSGNAVQASGSWAGGSASALIESFERAGLSRTLAEPTLTAISGETAKFHAGGEFPVPVSSKDREVSISFKEFGVKVDFTPVVLAEGRISLKVKAEVSELSQQGAILIEGFSIPGLQVRKAETTVEMPSGSALAMAGMLSDQTRQGVEGVPELRNVPILGALFRSKDYLNSQSELVIIVTPYIARSNDPSELSRPDEGFAPSTDLKGLFLGSLHRIYSPSGKLATSTVTGDLGFIVEYPENGALK